MAKGRALEGVTEYTYSGYIFGFSDEPWKIVLESKVACWWRGEIPPVVVEQTLGAGMDQVRPPRLFPAGL